MKYPDSEICNAAVDMVREFAPPFLFNHLMRSFAFGQSAGALRGAVYDEEVMFLGSVFHDLGLIEQFVRDDRFEIDGADAAADFLSERGYPDSKIALIWDAIALHSTLGVSQRKQPEIALVQLGAGIDVGAIPRSLLTADMVEEILAEFPRLGFKQAFLGAMAAVVRRKPHTGVTNLMGDVARECEHLPIPSFCEIIRRADFAS